MTHNPQTDLQIPIGIQGFSDIISTKRRYIDKTSYISQWVVKGAAMTNVIHRPRRFGKSLTLSCIQALYSHEKELFKDTSLPDYFWEECQYHPVIGFTLAVSVKRSSPENLESSVQDGLIREMKRLKIFQPKDRAIPGKEILNTAINRLLDQDPEHRPVIVIDEYDSLLNHAYEYGMDLAEAANEVASYLQPLKYKYKDIHASYVTGIMKYQGLKLMSSVNNPSDVSFHPEYAQMIGFTMEEIQAYFPREIEKLGRVHKMSTDEILNKIKTYYNGYCFSPEAIGKTVYAGYSFCCFAEEAYSFGDFWYSTGGMDTLFHHGRSQIWQIETLIEERKLNTSLSELKQGHKTQDSNEITLSTLLYYHGYLTFQTSDGSDAVDLVIPNEEVFRSFHRSCVENLFQISPIALEQGLLQIKKHIQQRAIEALIYLFAHLIAVIPSRLHIHAERYYQSLLLGLLSAIYGRNVSAERPLASGTPDLVLDLGQAVFIFEFKFVANDAEGIASTDQTPLIAALEAAKEQVISKRYLEAYRNVPSIFAIALVISQRDHNVVGYMVIETPTNNPAAEVLHKPIFLSSEKIKEMGDIRALEKVGSQRKAEPIDPQSPYVTPVTEKRIEAFNRMRDSASQREYELEKQLLLSQVETEKAKTETEKAKTETEKAKTEIEKARTEAEKARTEAEKARTEAEKARTEAEKARTEAERSKVTVEKTEREKQQLHMKFIWNLKNQNLSSQEICHTIGLTAEEWEQITGERIHLNPPPKSE